MIASVVKVVAFAIIVIAANIGLEYILPTGAGAKDQETKFQMFNKHPGIVDIVFIGSSRTNRHIYPSIIDSVLSSCLGREYVSYNLGLTDMNFHRNVYMARQVIRSKNPPRYIFVEITAKQHEKDINLGTSQGSFYVDNTTLRNVYSLTGEDESISDYEHDLRQNYRQAWMRRIIHLGYGKELLDKKKKSIRGFRPRKDQGPVDRLVNQKQQFENKLKSYNKAFYADMARYVDNSGMSEILIELIDEGAARNTRVVFFMNSTPHAFKQEFAIFNAIPNNHKLSLHQFNRLSELRDISYWHDPFHLNDYGARVVSQRFAQMFCNRTKKDRFVAPLK